MDPARVERTSQWSWVSKAIFSYWCAYGKWRMVLTSPFLHASILIALLLMPAWGGGAIQDKALAVIPSMLGFSLAAFTFSLGIGTDNFRLILGARRAGNKPSLVSGLSTAFVHFLFVQTIALIVNVLLSAHWVSFLLATIGIAWQDLPEYARLCLVGIKWFLGGVSALVFIYAVLSGIPAVLHIYMAAKVFEVFSSKFVSPGGGANNQSASSDGEDAQKGRKGG